MIRHLHTRVKGWIHGLVHGVRLLVATLSGVSSYVDQVFFLLVLQLYKQEREIEYCHYSQIWDIFSKASKTFRTQQYLILNNI